MERQAVHVVLDNDGAFQRQSPRTAGRQPPHDHETRAASSRVCDRCIQKKMKCDLQRPTCSRCFERGYTCTYSSTRRKPGPARGSRRGRPSREPRGYPSEHVSGRQGYPTSPRSSEVTQLSTEVLGDRGHTEVIQSVSPSTTARGSDDAGPNDILPEEEDHLLSEYFDSIHEAIPILSKHDFISDRTNSSYTRDLITTVVIVTAKLTGYTFSSANFDIDARIDKILTSGYHEEEMFGDSPSIEQIRKACLLAFYEFHQFPGQQAWMRIGKLTRMALWIGLDRLENLQTLYPGFAAMTERQLEDWRLVWWCIYRLDSYANLSSGTPYLIDERLINTALVQDQEWDSLRGTQQGSVNSRIILPSDPGGLWELLPAITSSSRQTLLFNMHIITTTIMRQTGRALRLHKFQPQQGAGQLADIERHLSEVRLALPTNYLNTRRNAFTNESGVDHHARLITLFHLNMTRLLISIMSCFRHEEGEQWLLRWQQVLEACQDMASISEQWDSSHILRVDPAISFIIFTALIFLDIQKKSAPTLMVNPDPTVQHYETVLLMQLEQFAAVWTLPRLLTLALKSFRETVTGPLTYHHIQYILSHFEAPLHPRWLQFLSTAQAELVEYQ